MTKYQQDMRVETIYPIGSQYTLMQLTPADGSKLPLINPGQFVQVEISGSKTTMLRRPISVNDVDYNTNRLSLLIRKAGDSTRALCDSRVGQIINIVYPLGNGFPEEEIEGKRVLLIGGGVGVAPLLYYGRRLIWRGNDCAFLLGARSEKDLLLFNEFNAIAKVYTATEDGSAGTRGFVTDSPAMSENYDVWAVCGPMPMMKAVAALARKRGVECYVSLENMMACGVGACLCCVEKTIHGNQCVCTNGPVFNINELTW